MTLYTHSFRRLLSLPLLFVTAFSSANDIQVTNVDLITAGQPAGNADIRLDVSWQNSWNTSVVNNFDAAWVFVKYRTVGNVWNHVYLQNTGHTGTSSPANVIQAGRVNQGLPFNVTSNPAVGVFIYRATQGSGTFTVTNVRLKWNYAAQGLLLSDIQEIKVFALEMVLVPEGPFAAGSGGTEPNAFTLTTINTEDATVPPSGSGGFNGSPTGGHPIGSSGDYELPAFDGFPNGFWGFFCMKYEISQQGYVDFLNTLTFDQQANNTSVPPDSPAGTRAMTTASENLTPRRAIRIAVPGLVGVQPAVYGCDLNGNGIFGETNDGMDLACPDLRPEGPPISVDHIAAYLVWAGLRPMSELEFEKACRGTATPIPNEFAWGNTTINTQAYGLSAAGSRDEGIASNFSTTSGNVNYSTTGGLTNGPLRVGIFAAQPGSTDRVSAGASYWGIMELDGNVGEFVRPMRTEGTGDQYDQFLYFVHGNGDINVAPPGFNTRGSRSGGYGNSDPLRTSNRTHAGSSSSLSGLLFGGRGVRATPF